MSCCTRRTAASSHHTRYPTMSRYDASVEKEKAAKAKGKDNGINAISNTEPEQSVRGWEQGRMCVFGEKGGERGLMFVETLL